MQFSKWVTLGFGALCLMAVAGVLNAQHLYYMSAILLTLPGVSYALGWSALRGLEFERELPPTAWEGEESGIVYAAQNTTRFPRYFLTIREQLPNWITPVEAEPPLFNVMAGETTRVVYPIRFQKRGVYRIHTLEVTALDPLGVFAFTRRVPCDAELVVYPFPQPLLPMALSGEERFGWQEFTRLALQGSSVEPNGVREYAPGDPLRRIHWRQTARTGKLSVIEFEESQAVNLVIALDLKRGTEAGTGRDTTLEYAVRLAASLGQQAVQQGASLRLLLPADAGGDGLPAAAQSGRGMHQLYSVLDALARVEANSMESIGSVITYAGGSLMPGTTLIVLTSHPDPELPGALTRYTVTGANVGVIFIDPETFPGSKVRIPAADRQHFFAGLFGAQTRPFLLQYNQRNELYPEALANADTRLTEPARN